LFLKWARPSIHTHKQFAFLTPSLFWFLFLKSEKKWGRKRSKEDKRNMETEKKVATRERDLFFVC